MPIAAGLLMLLAPDVAPAQTLQASSARRTLSLAEAIERAEKQSETVRIAEAAVLRARGTLARARSQLFPQLYGSAQFQKTVISQFEEVAEAASGGGGEPGPAVMSLCSPFIPETATPAERAAALDQARTCPGDAENPLAKIFASENQLTLGLSASQSLFNGGRIISQSNAARAGREAAEIGLTAERALLRLTVTEAYYDAALTERLVAIADSSLIQTESALRQTQLARQVGNLSEFDLLRARVTRDNQRPIAIQRRTERDLAHLRLKQLLDLPLDEPLDLSSDILDALPVPLQSIATLAANEGPDAWATRHSATVDSVVAASDTSTASRSSVRQAEQGVKAQRNLLRAARAQRLPAVTLSSQYGRIAYPPSGIPQWGDFFSNWTVSLGLQVPIFVGGRIRAEEMLAQADLLEAREQYTQAREYAALDARSAIAALEEAEASWGASAGTAEQANRAYTIAEVRYREGLSTQLELTESRILLQQAQANRAYAARNLQVARVRLALLPDLPLGSGNQDQAAAARQRRQQQEQQQQQQQQSQPPQAASGFTQNANSGGTLQ